MRRVLLGTSALVAASVLGAEGAQAKFDVTINGVYMGVYGMVNESDKRGEQGFRRSGAQRCRDSPAQHRVSGERDLHVCPSASATQMSRYTSRPASE